MSMVFETIEAYRLKSIMEDKQIDIVEVDGKWRIISTVTDFCWPYTYDDKEQAISAILDKKGGEF
ncbi:MAG: hypothetical protein ACRDD8_14170 [Bacteroidales bacterium]